ncbi:hypothetical protein C7M84_011393 [Penaeus vannamei]|uniref:Uncharacterized protein n=1 Tax=Penaeus vannamei TaxID=6689 RepID=A0A423T1F9_PENVA|nr:hypothetical protein C7M84_011393 [Penaeus vannamei]
MTIDITSTTTSTDMYPYLPQQSQLYPQSSPFLRHHNHLFRPAETPRSTARKPCHFLIHCTEVENKGRDPSSLNHIITVAVDFLIKIISSLQDGRYWQYLQFLNNVSHQLPPSPSSPTYLIFVVPLLCLSTLLILLLVVLIFLFQHSPTRPPLPILFFSSPPLPLPLLLLFIFLFLFRFIASCFHHPLLFCPNPHISPCIPHPPSLFHSLPPLVILSLPLLSLFSSSVLHPLSSSVFPPLSFITSSYTLVPLLSRFPPSCTPSLLLLSLSPLVILSPRSPPPFPPLSIEAPVIIKRASVSVTARCFSLATLLGRYYDIGVSPCVMGMSPSPRRFASPSPRSLPLPSLASPHPTLARLSSQSLPDSPLFFSLLFPSLISVLASSSPPLRLQIFFLFFLFSFLLYFHLPFRSLI